MGHWSPLSRLPQEINDTSNTSQTSCDNYGWPTQTAAGSPSQCWVTLSKEVMVRNLRGGQTFCLVSVTHPACEPLLSFGPPWEGNVTTGIKSTPKAWRKAIFGTVWSRRIGRNRHQAVGIHNSSLLMGKTCSEVYLLHPARMESAGSTNSAASQGIARLLPVTKLFTTWKWTNGKLALSPVLLSTCNGSISNSWKFHLPQIWMKTTLSAQSWQEKLELTSSYMEERPLFILPSNSTSVHGEDQGVDTGKHPLHSAG